MRFAHSLLIFSYGLFAIAVQSLLFREYLSTFEGNDISVGIFFASWFLWVGLGARVVYRMRAVATKLLENIDLLFLSYLPAFILELFLIINARELAGAEAYAFLSIRQILLLSIVVNAPVSVITGMLFPTVCRWVQKEKGAVSRVYIMEAAGSFVGGLGVTVLLAIGVSLVRTFLILSLLLSLSVFFVQLKHSTQNRKLKLRAKFLLIIPVCILFCFALGADKTLMRYIRVVKWTKLLPADSLKGSFKTAQAEYLYGVYQGQWLAVREGGVVEALPDETSAGRTAAIGLSQMPDATKVLVIGSGLGICRELLELPQIEKVTWAHCDNEYVQNVNRFIPPELQVNDERFVPVSGDVRMLLAEERQLFDIVIVNLPDATSSVLNRYFTLEFYRQVKRALSSDGVLTVRIAGGENIMGTELVNLGASTKLTLEKVFSEFVLIPGEDTWFIVSDSENITGEPGILKDRFASISGGSDVFNPQALLSVYLPDRAEKALESYAGADLPEEYLINRDSRPLTHLYSLLLTAKQSGAPAARLVKHLVLGGPLVFLVPVLVFAALRVIYILKLSEGGSRTGFDSSFLVFSAGLVGIGVVIVLMYMYQTRFGSLYLHIGIISSVFMMGLTAGAALTRKLLTRLSQRRAEILLLVLIFVHSLILWAIAFWPGEHWTRLTFAIVFVLCGLCAGCYFPISVWQLFDCGFDAGQTGSRLETADHLGASAGGVLTSLALVPVLGVRITLFIFFVLIVINIPSAALRIYKPGIARFSGISTLPLRRLGFLLFGVGVCVIVCSNLLADAGAKLRPTLPRYAGEALSGQSEIEAVSTRRGGDGRQMTYFKVYEGEELKGYIFSSKDLAGQVRGFGGEINLAIYADTEGKLIDFHIIRSNETPGYLEMLSQWRLSLNGRRLFGTKPFADVEGVSGATVSSEAILEALDASGVRFAAQVLGLTEQPEAREQAKLYSYLPDVTGIYLISAVIVTFAVIYYGGFWSRLAVLCFNLVVGGIVLNAQYSSEQIATILTLQSPSSGLSGAYLSAVGIPLLVLLFGNIYCGYICPFGAAQELLGFIVGKRFRPVVTLEKMKQARFVKYVILFVLIAVFFVSRERRTLAADPLISVFSLRFTVIDFQSTILLIAGIALAGSVFYPRFWCRYLCPVGAGLSLLNKIVIFKRALPAKRFGRCEFGLTGDDKTDCLYCDKCRFEKQPGRGAGGRSSSRIFLICVLALAIFVSTVSVSRFLQVVPAAGLDEAAVTASGGQPRDVDLQRIRTLIRQKKLSDKEAEFYRKLD